MRRGMTRLRTRRWAVITLVVLIIGIAVVAISLRQGVLKKVWVSATYTDWKPEEFGFVLSTGGVKTYATPLHYYRVKRQRWPWLPGQDVIRIRIPNHEYESMMKERNRRAKGGQ